MGRVLPNKVGTRLRLKPQHPDGGATVAYAYSTHWPCLFPQHGPGRKHQRPIVLASWQQAIVDTFPDQLVRGLIFSDGCRCLNRVHGGRYSYSRYLFTNRSADICAIFIGALERLGIGSTVTANPERTTVSIARCGDVARLDGFVEPKR